MRTVLHVLPHPGGGGETYVDTLSAMEGYRFERFYLASGPRPADALKTMPRMLATVQLAARKHDLIHVEGEVASAISLPGLALRPSVVTLNGLHLLRRAQGVKRLAAIVNLRAIVRAASRVICVSESEHDDLLAAVGEGAAGKVALIHNGVPPSTPPSAAERAAARDAVGVSVGTTVALWVGGLDEHKDPRTVVRAAIDTVGRDSSFVLLVAGDGPLRRELEELTDGVEAVRILGFREDVRKLLCAADLFVLSSRREGLSFALLEAMSMGLAAIVSDGPGNADAVGDVGIVAPIGDVDAFASAMTRLSTDIGLRASLGEGARLRAARRFSASEMIRRTRKVYDGL